MSAVFIVVAVLAIVEFVMLLILSWAGLRYDEVIGRPPPEKEISMAQQHARRARGSDRQATGGLRGLSGWWW